MTPKSVPRSPQGPRKHAAPSKEAARTLCAPPPSGMDKEPGARLLRPGSGCFAAGSLPGSSPLASPRGQRRTPSAAVAGPSGKPYARERKNSITEISDNEDELLEYHRRQREERLREQEMERLVSPTPLAC